MGCVLPAGQGQAPARQAAHHAGLPRSVPAVTVNKVCGSGLKAVVLGRQRHPAGDAELVVAGGMESMSRAPYLLPKAREGLRLGHGQLLDSMIHDGLWDAYGDVHMGDCAELCAREKGISRADQDAYAAESYRRARARPGDGQVRARRSPRSRSPSARGRPGWSTRTRSPARAIPTSCPACARLPEGRHRHRRQRLVAERRRRGGGAGVGRGRSGAGAQAAGPHRGLRPATPRRPSGSPPRRPAPSSACARRSAGARRRSTCGRSTRPSRWCRSSTTGCWASTPRG